MVRLRRGLADMQIACENKIFAGFPLRICGSPSFVRVSLLEVGRQVRILHGEVSAAKGEVFLMAVLDRVVSSFLRHLRNGPEHSRFADGIARHRFAGAYDRFAEWDPLDGNEDRPAHGPAAAVVFYHACGFFFVFLLDILFFLCIVIPVSILC